MTDAAQTDGGTRRKLPMLITVALFAVGASLGVAVVMFGWVSSLFDGHAEAPVSDAAFVPVEQITVGVDGGRRFLRFSAQIEVAAGNEAAVIAVMPRIVDVMNTYLRSTSMVDIGSPAAMLQIRAQLLRRIDLVVGHDLVRDLLVMEFVVN